MFICLDAARSPLFGPSRPLSYCRYKLLEDVYDLAVSWPLHLREMGLFGLSYKHLRVRHGASSESCPLYIDA